MLELINFTDLTDEQILMVLRWRNDERVAKYMKNKSVSEQEHRNFISNLKNDETKRYFLVQQIDEAKSDQIRNGNENNITQISATKSKNDNKNESSINEPINNKSIKNDEYVGVIYFTGISKNTCEFGLYAKPQLIGVGKLLMQAIIDYAFKALNVKELKACVFNKNIKAIALYDKFDFKFYDRDSKISYIKLVNPTL